MSAFKDSCERSGTGWRRTLRLGGILAAAFVLGGCTVYDTGYRGSAYYGYGGPYLYSDYYYGTWSRPIVVERRGHVHRRRPQYVQRKGSHHVRPAPRPRPGYSRPNKRRHARPGTSHRDGKAGFLRQAPRAPRPDNVMPSRPMHSPKISGSRHRR